MAFDGYEHDSFWNGIPKPRIRRANPYTPERDATGPSRAQFPPPQPSFLNDIESRIGGAIDSATQFLFSPRGRKTAKKVATNFAKNALLGPPKQRPPLRPPAAVLNSPMPVGDTELPVAVPEAAAPVSVQVEQEALPPPFDYEEFGRKFWESQNAAGRKAAAARLRKPADGLRSMVKSRRAANRAARETPVPAMDYQPFEFGQNGSVILGEPVQRPVTIDPGQWADPITGMPYEKQPTDYRREMLEGRKYNRWAGFTTAWGQRNITADSLPSAERAALAKNRMSVNAGLVGQLTRKYAPQIRDAQLRLQAAIEASDDEGVAEATEELNAIKADIARKSALQRMNWTPDPKEIERLRKYEARIAAKRHNRLAGALALVQGVPIGEGGTLTPGMLRTARAMMEGTARRRRLGRGEAPGAMRPITAKDRAALMEQQAAMAIARAQQMQAMSAALGNLAATNEETGAVTPFDITTSWGADAFRRIFGGVGQSGAGPSESPVAPQLPVVPPSPRGIATAPPQEQTQPEQTQRRKGPRPEDGIVLNPAEPWRKAYPVNTDIPPLSAWLRAFNAVANPAPGIFDPNKLRGFVTP